MTSSLFVSFVNAWKLEEHLNTNFTHPLLISSSDSESDKESRPSPREIKDKIARSDKSLLLEKCSKNQDTRLIADIARIVSWSKLWDLALNDGPKCVNALHSFVRIISHPSHSNRACPICDVNSLDSSLLAHILSSHVDTSNDASDILTLYGLQLRPQLLTRMLKTLILIHALQVL